MYDKQPVNMTEPKIQNELREAKYYGIFRSLYRAIGWNANHNPLYEYSNPYELREFEVFKFSGHLYDTPVPVYKKEYVFLCLLKHEDSDELMPFYVSKAYFEHNDLRTYRFVFPQFPEEEKYRYAYEYEKLMLAEGSAEAYIRPDFNVEHYYLENHRPVGTNTFYN